MCTFQCSAEIKKKRRNNNYYMISNVVFTLLLIAGGSFFAVNVRKIARNIKLGRNTDRSDHPGERLAVMTRVALGQSKMVVRPVPGILHIFVYLGFIIINLEVLEIIIDGITGSHRVFAPLGNFYNILIA